MFTELTLPGFPCCAGTSERDSLEEGIELPLVWFHRFYSMICWLHCLGACGKVEDRGGSTGRNKSYLPSRWKAMTDGKSPGPHCPHPEQIPNNSVPFTKAHTHLRVPPPPRSFTDWCLSLQHTGLWETIQIPSTAWSYSLNCLQSSLQQRSLSISTHSVCKKFKVGPCSCTQHLKVKKNRNEITHHKP